MKNYGHHSWCETARACTHIYNKKEDGEKNKNNKETANPFYSCTYIYK